MIEKAQLEDLRRDGFSIIPDALPLSLIAEFERQIGCLVDSQLQALGIESSHEDPFIEVFTASPEYHDRFYKLLENLEILARMTAHITHGLRQCGFFDALGIQVPLVWPDIRADEPGDTVRTLPVHQDYVSRLCENAVRLWIPLRRVDATFGSMRIFPGTHARGMTAHVETGRMRREIPPSEYTGRDSVIFDLQPGDCVLMDPLVFHQSVTNRSQRTRFVLMVQIQDMTTMIHPESPPATGT